MGKQGTEKAICIIGRCGGKRIKNGDKKKRNRETTLKRPYASCPKINRKNYEENRKKVLTMVESVVL